ncbi:MAG TPA: His/Gly/Thr/Pro-type tRNA ligase C-terminal domain-containing protein [Candidatus Paceibacterota bacterium]|nr:His/Gly/Thr/Pro-type tRNA ligase C-terminal domain-containing protein [Candidatus Paceibacterota bacterium]
MRPQEPVLAFYATPSPAHTPSTIPSRESGEFGLQVVGTAESVGEIVILKTITTIAREWGLTIARVRINALGDKDSQLRFLRELSVHIRKHIERLPEAERKTILGDPFLLYRMREDVVREILAEGPRPMHFLSERSRGHFRSVLEHLEHLGLPYELDDLLAGDERGPHISFALDFDDSDTTVFAAIGGRFDEYFKRETRRKDSSGVGASIFFRKKGAGRQHFTMQPVVRKPKIYFAQLGLRAKLQGLTVVDMLRSANIPVLQSFDANRLSLQLATAQQLGVSHLLIMGQREALDGTVIVRSTRNSAQNIIAITEVPRFLKTLR